MTNLIRPATPRVHHLRALHSQLMHSSGLLVWPGVHSRLECERLGSIPIQSVQLVDPTLSHHVSSIIAVPLFCLLNLRIKSRKAVFSLLFIWHDCLWSCKVWRQAWLFTSVFISFQQQWQNNRDKNCIQKQSRLQNSVLAVFFYQLHFPKRFLIELLTST